MERRRRRRRFRRSGGGARAASARWGAIRISLVAPDPAFAYRPAATLEAFSDATPRAFDLGAIAVDLGVRYHRTRIESVLGARRQAMLETGGRLTYDALVLATGARATVGVTGALTFRDRRDLARLRDLVRELDQRKLHTLVFAVPAGGSWPLPLYELALLSAGRARAHGAGTEVTVVSPEPCCTTLWVDAWRPPRLAGDRRVG